MSLHCILHATLLGCIVCNSHTKELIRCCMWLRLLFDVVLTVHDYDCGDDTTSMIYNRFGAPDPNTTPARPIIGPCLYVHGELAVTVAAAGPATWKKEVLKI